MGEVRVVGENWWMRLPLGEGWVDMGGGGSRGRQGGEVGDANLGDGWGKQRSFRNCYSS